MNNDIIYVTGDSFTAGEDLSDYIIKPDFEGYSLKEFEYYNNSNLIEDIYLSWNKIRYNYDNYNIQDVLRNNEKKRWSNHLSNLLKIPVFNNSEGGIATDNILYRTVLDIHYLKSCGMTVKEVIVQITEPSRFTYFDVNINSGYHSGSHPLWIQGLDPEIKWHACSRHINKSKSNVNECNLFKQNILLQDYDSLLYKTFMIFKIYETTVRDLIKKSPIFVDSYFWKTKGMYNNLNEAIQRTRINNKNWQKDFILNNYALDFYDNVKLSMLDCIANDEEKVFTANFHLNEVIHERFAERIANTYFNYVK